MTAAPFFYQDAAWKLLLSQFRYNRVVAQGNHKVDEKDQSKYVTSAWVEAGERLISHLEVENLKMILKGRK